MKQTGLLALAVALSCLAPRSAVAQTIFTEGQFSFIDVSFDNSVPNDPQWSNRIFNETFLQPYDPVFDNNLNRWVFDHPQGAVFQVGGPQHLWVRPASGVWNFIGVGPGALFRATPQNGDPNTRLIFGIASFGVPNGVFVNNQFTITLSLAGINNPGDFSIYTNDDQFNNALGTLDAVYLSTFENMLSFTRTSGSQNNFNLAFSQPGIYELDFEFSGTREVSAGGGTIVSDLYRYTFIINAIPEPGTWAMLGAATVTALGAGLVWRRRIKQSSEMVVDDS